MQCIGKPTVAGVAGEHDPAGAGGAGDRGGAGVVLAALGVGEAVRVVTELGQNPGAENGAEPGLTEVDLSVPVSAKMLGHHLLQRVDLGVERGDEADLADHDRGVGLLHGGWLPQRRRPQHGLQLPGPRLDIPPLRPPQRRGQLRPRQPRRPVGIRCPTKQLEGVGRGQIVKGLQRGRKVLAQRTAQPQHLPCPVPDHALVGPGHELDRLGVRAVAERLGGDDRGPAAQSRRARAHHRHRFSRPRWSAAPDTAPPASG